MTFKLKKIGSLNKVENNMFLLKVEFYIGGGEYEPLEQIFELNEKEQMFSFIEELKLFNNWVLLANADLSIYSKLMKEHLSEFIENSVEEIRFDGFSNNRKECHQIEIIEYDKNGNNQSYSLISE